MIDRETVDAHLLGDRCHGCGGAKRIGHPFCQGCTKLLPARMQAALSSKGENFARAYEQAGRCIVERKKTAREVNAGRFSRIDYRRA